MMYWSNLLLGTKNMYNSQEVKINTKQCAVPISYIIICNSETYMYILYIPLYFLQVSEHNNIKLYIVIKKLSYVHNYTGIKYSLQQGQILDPRRVGGVNRDIYIHGLEM